MMQPFRLSFCCLGLASIVVGLGCASRGEAPASDFAVVQRERGSSERKIVRSGDLVVVLDAPEVASSDVERIVRDADGFVERSTVTRDASVRTSARVPADRLDAVMDAIAALGEEEHRSVSAADVTDQVYDLETRLRNDRALRDRLQQLLARASDVEDVLAIEKELNRIQTEIETRQAHFDRLQSEIALSVLSVELRPELVLGPLGYVGALVGALQAVRDPLAVGPKHVVHGFL